MYHWHMWIGSQKESLRGPVVLLYLFARLKKSLFITLKKEMDGTFSI